MLVRALLVIILLVGGYFFIRWLRRSPWAVRMPQVLLAMGATGFLILLTVRGGAEIAIPLLAVLAPFFLRWFNAQPSPPAMVGPASSSQSAINTRFLYMTLDHATGVMSGRVREGCFAGCGLQELDFQEYLELWQECRVDSQSVAVLEAYLDRHVNPAWRDRLGDGERCKETGETTTDHGNMNQAEAYEILGLRVGASRDEIQAAYRRLIQRLHPDQGGSAYLAACLNRARGLLLRSMGKE